MNGRFVAALGLMMAVASVSGCLEAMQFLSSEDGEVTAQANRDLADSAARAWNPDAQLMAVFAIENPNMTDEFPSDPNPGNGLAPVWLYAYGAQNGTEHRAFQVSADGQVRVLNDSTMGATEVGMPIGSWQTDSDAAVETARANATFEAVAAEPGAVVMEALGAEEGTTVWAIMAGTGTRQAIAVINAIDGSLIFAEAFDMEFDLPAMPMWGVSGASWSEPQLVMEESGTLSAGLLSGESAEYPFEISRADLAHFELTFSGSLPTDSISWMVYDEEGEPVVEDMSWDYNPMDGGVMMAEFPLEEAGEYTLVLQYESSIWVPVPTGSVDYAFRLVVGPMPEGDISSDAGTTCC